MLLPHRVWNCIRIHGLSSKADMIRAIQNKRNIIDDIYGIGPAAKRAILRWIEWPDTSNDGRRNIMGFKKPLPDNMQDYMKAGCKRGNMSGIVEHRVWDEGKLIVLVRLDDNMGTTFFIVPPGKKGKNGTEYQAISSKGNVVCDVDLSRFPMENKKIFFGVTHSNPPFVDYLRF